MNKTGGGHIDSFENIGGHDIHLRLSNPQDHERIARIARALSSSARLRILDILKDTVFNIQEISRMLNLPLSTTAQHIQVLEEADLVVTRTSPGVRGSMRLCTCNVHSFTLDTYDADRTSNENTVTSEMPVGHYHACSVAAPCGLADHNGTIDSLDSPRAFYFPERCGAQLLWFHQGYVEYRFPNLANPHLNLQEISFSMEICSEAPGHSTDWLSDITVSVNGCEVITYTSPCDFGNRRGALTPSVWPNGCSQYGLLKLFSIRSSGVYLDGQFVDRHPTIAELAIHEQDYISLRIEVKKDAKNIGGVNIFGKTYGDYPQDILMRLTY